MAVCGGGKVPGRDESLPYGLNRRRDLAVSCGPGMPGPYRVVMGKRDVAAGWRAAYMRPLQIGGSLQLRGFGALACPAGASIAHYPAPRRNSETFLCYFLLVTKESKTSRGTAAPCGFTQILHNIYFPVVV